MISLKLIRTTRGISLKELADATGIPHQRLSDIENGRMPIKDQYLNSIENVLHISILNDTNDDLEILNFFNDFVDTLFYGYNELVAIEKSCLN